MRDAVDLFLHPVRMRIIQALVGQKAYSAQQMMELLPDIPQATFYRQLNTLTKAGVVKVVDEHRVRGTVERIYALGENGGDLTTEVTEKGRDEHLQYFMGFVAKMLDDFGSYVNQPSYDMRKDGASFRLAATHLSDDEFQDFVVRLRGLLQEAMFKPPAPDRRLRLIANVFIPEAKQDS